MTKHLTLRLFIGLAFLGLLIIQSCSKDKNDTPEILSPKLDLIINTEWQCSGISRITYNDTTTYYGGLYIINNDSMTYIPVNKSTGELSDTHSQWSCDILDTGFVFKRKHREIVDSIITVNRSYELFWFSHQNVLEMDFGIYCSAVGEKSTIQLSDSMYSKIIEFEIGGYKIGDIISKDLVIINDVENYYSPPRERGHLKNDENLHLTIIGDSIISSIEQKEISDSDIDDIIKVITDKTGFEPDYSLDTAKSEFWDLAIERYAWWNLSDGYNIDLSRFQNIVNDNTDDITKRMLLMSGIGWRKWDLEVENNVLESMIKAIYLSNDGMPKSKSKYIK